RAPAPIDRVELGPAQLVGLGRERDLARQQLGVLRQQRRRLHRAGEVAKTAFAAAERHRQIQPERQGVYASAAALAAPYAEYHGLAASRLRFTASMLARPWVPSHCSNAPKPCLA